MRASSVRSGGQPSRRAAPPAGRRNHMAGRRTRGRYGPRRGRPARRARRAADDLGARAPSGVQVRADRGDRARGRCRRRLRSRRRARAPRCRARRSRRRGRARAARRRRRGSRRAPRGRGPPSGACRGPARGACSRRPLYSPATTLTPGSGRARAEARRRRVAQQRVLRLAQLAGRRSSSSLGPLAGALEQLGVLGQARDPELRQAVLAGAEHLAGAAQLEVDLGERKPSRSLGDRLEPRQLRVAEQDAERRVLAAARPARAAGGAARGRSARRPRSASPSRSGTSMPTSITLVATSTSASPAANASIASGFSRVRHLAVDQLDALVAELGGAQALGLGGRRLRLERLGLLDQRADHEALAARGDLLADALVGPRPRARAVDHVGLDRPAAGRQLAQRRSRRGRRRRSAPACAGSAWRSCAARAAPARRAPWRRAPPAGARRSGAARRRRTAPASGTRRPPRSARACRRPGRARREASRPSSSRRRPAGVEPVSSSIGTSPPSSRSSVARCCSASVSVGAISAAWRPLSTARSIACSATTVLPRPHLAHQQPLHRPLAVPGRRRSARTRARWSPVGSNGSVAQPRVDQLARRLERRRAGAPSRRARRAAGHAPAPAAAAPRTRAARAPRPPRPRPRGSAPPASAAGRSGRRSAARSRGGQRLDDVGARARGRSQTSWRRRSRGDAPRWRGTAAPGPCGRGAPPPSERPRTP